MQKDSKLGHEIHTLFKKKGIENPLNPTEGNQHPMEAIQTHMAIILSALGLDIKDESIADTPKRVAKMFVHEIFAGLNYDNFPKCTMSPNPGYDEVVISRGGIIRSTCEHHFQPIYGKVHIGYLPNEKMIGLSKLNRVSDFFARRPQVQERLTIQIYEALAYLLDTPDVAVVIEAEHFCMRMRGVEDPCADTITSKVGGRFMDVPALREEFMNLIRSK